MYTNRYKEIPNVYARDFSGLELAKMLEIIEAARTCNDEVSFCDAILRSKELLDMDFAISGLAKKEEDGSLTILSMINGDYPDEWLEIYRSEELYRVDPIVKYHQRYSMTQPWSVSIKAMGNDLSAQLLCRADDFGLKYGLSSSIVSLETQVFGIFSFASRQDRYDEHHKKILDIIVLHLYRALAGLYKNSINKAEILTC